jgi:hypothetical protein
MSTLEVPPGVAKDLTDLEAMGTPLWDMNEVLRILEEQEWWETYDWIDEHLEEYENNIGDGFEPTTEG